MEAAIAAASNGGVLTLTGDAKSTGIPVASGSNLTLDLNGHELFMEGPFTGSEGTKTLGFQFLKGSDVIIKNGTIRSTDAKMVIQNYSNLTLDNVTIIGSETNQYLVSNNFGDVHFKNGTTLKASGKTVAFDVYYGMFAVYDDGVSVTIDTDDVVIEGKFEYGKASRATEEGFKANAHLYVPEGYPLAAPEGYTWKVVENGMQELVAL